MPVSNQSHYVALAVFAIIAAIVIAFLMQPRETPSEKMANAIGNMGDSIQDAGDAIEERMEN